MRGQRVGCRISRSGATGGRWVQWGMQPREGRARLLRRLVRDDACGDEVGDFFGGEAGELGEDFVVVLAEEGGGAERGVVGELGEVDWGAGGEEAGGLGLVDFGEGVAGGELRVGEDAGGIEDGGGGDAELLELVGEGDVVVGGGPGGEGVVNLIVDGAARVDIESLPRLGEVGGGAEGAPGVVIEDGEGDVVVVAGGGVDALGGEVGVAVAEDGWVVAE